MALHTAVSAATCGVKPVDVVQSMDVGGLPCSLDEDCVKAPSEGRMRDFLSFLDQTASNPLQCNGRPPKESNSPGEPASTADLLSKISALEVELEDKDHNLKAFQELREREKLQEERLRKQLQQQLQGDISRTTEKYEQQCRKQQELLSQLQDEKKDLATRCERLSDEMRDLERRFRTKAAEMHRQYGRELERQRRAFLSGEKARREAWARERAQEIKEITIKGLEPEIQRLLNKHRAEKRLLEEKLRKIPEDMKKQLEEELATQKVALQRQMEEAFEVERIQHRQEMRTLKETYEAEVAKEREALAAKQKQQTAKLEAQLTEGKKRLQGEITKAREEEQTRMKEVTSQLLAQLEQQRNKHLKELQQVEAAAKEKEKELLLQMKEAKEAAIHEATEQTKKEMQARAHKKLDHILERLSEEQLAVQNQQEKTWIEKMQKREKEFEECKNIFEKHSEKLKNDLKAEAESRLALEKQIARMEAEAEMKEKELTELKAKIEGINARGEALQREQQLRNEELERECNQSKEKYEAQQEELRNHRTAMEEMSTKLETATKKLTQMERNEELVLKTLEEKVRETIKAKDKQIQRLADLLAASNTKAEHLRSLLSRRRNDDLLCLTPSSSSSASSSSSLSSSSSSSSSSSMSCSLPSTTSSSTNDYKEELSIKKEPNLNFSHKINSKTTNVEGGKRRATITIQKALKPLQKIK